MNKSLQHFSLGIVFMLLLPFLVECNVVSGFQLAPNPTINEEDLYAEFFSIRNCADFENG